MIDKQCKFQSQYSGNHFHTPSLTTLCQIPLALWPKGDIWTAYTIMARIPWFFLQPSPTNITMHISLRINESTKSCA